MKRSGISVRKWTMLIHRWMGVTFCVLFVAWFVSGIVMMYCPYPRVNPEDRLVRSQPLDAARLSLSPAEALSKIGLAGPFSRISLAVLDGRPVYRFTAGRQHAAVFADDGQQVRPVAKDTALRIASAWAGETADSAAVEGPLSEPDQWTVPQGTQAYGPFWKCSWSTGDEVYVSTKTGEVAQHTTTASRLGAWFGAVPHWIYFTPLRARPQLWNQVVVWLSGAGTVMSILGLIAGVWLYSPSGKYRTPTGRTSVPYAGQKRLHVILGLLFGLVTCTWIFSGMMSMGPFAWFRDSSKQPNVERALRGTSPDLTAFEAKLPREALLEVKGELEVKELELTSLAGRSVYLALEAAGKSRIVPVHGEPLDAVSKDEIVSIVQPSVRPWSIIEAKPITEYEAYYVDRKRLRPLPAVRIRLDDPDDSLYYIDPKTARVVQSYGHSSRWNRWLYHGLHSFDLPLLYRYRPTWDIVVLFLMAGGTWLCYTAVVIGWRRLVQKTRVGPRKSASVRAGIVVTGDPAN